MLSRTDVRVEMKRTSSRSVFSKLIQKKPASSRPDALTPRATWYAMSPPVFANTTPASAV
jgi:hypothetical protein